MFVVSMLVECMLLWAAKDRGRERGREGEREGGGMEGER